MNAISSIELRNVSKRFGATPSLSQLVARRLGARITTPVVRAVDNVSFIQRAGEVVGLVGESGCGKSTLGRIVADVISPSDGEILVDGQARAQDLPTRLAVQMVFQDPYASLNPRFRIERTLAEAPQVHRLIKTSGRDAFVDTLLRQVGLDPSYKRRYPHQFSGGQRQRIGIARALAVNPEFLVCDEPVAALDVSVQAQVLNLFMRLKSELGLSYLFISHDIGVIRHIADQVLIMYLGRIVESASAEELFKRPNHPYTRGLLSQAPSLSHRGTKFVQITGEIPSPLNPPAGCHFHPRCPYAVERCKIESPALRPVTTGHLSACHLNEPA